MGRWVALSGTPGTGKSTVAELLPPAWRTVEVSDLARKLRAARRIRGRGVSVDLDGMAERFPRAGRSDRLLVGHLAHLLPVRDVLLLRCHPLELDRRLRAARRGTARSRYENVASEAIDLILVEARARRRRVWEVDTTARSPASVARELLRHLSGRSAPSSGRVRWLTDPRVTDYLLRRSP